MEEQEEWAPLFREEDSSVLDNDEFGDISPEFSNDENSNKGEAVSDTTFSDQQVPINGVDLSATNRTGKSLHTESTVDVSSDNLNTDGQVGDVDITNAQKICLDNLLAHGLGKSCFGKTNYSLLPPVNHTLSFNNGPDSVGPNRTGLVTGSD